MAYKFRKSLGGFNTRDVVDYLHVLTEKHQNECFALQNRIDALTKDNDVLRTQLDAAESELQEYRGIAITQKEADELKANAESRSEELRTLAESIREKLMEAGTILENTLSSL